MSGRVRFSAATHFGRLWPACQAGAWARRVLRTGSPTIRGSWWDFRLAATWPALRVQSATWSVTHRMYVQAASRLAGSAAFGLGKVNWWGIVHTTGCLKRRGTGATANSTLASRSPVKFQEPAIQ